MHTDTCVYKHIMHTYTHQHVQSERCSTKWQSCSTIPIAKTTCEQNAISDRVISPEKCQSLSHVAHKCRMATRGMRAQCAGAVRGGASCSLCD